MELPEPINGAEVYLSAVLDELKGLRADLRASPMPAAADDTTPTATGIISLKEPAAAPAKETRKRR